MRSKQLLGVFILFITAAIWGSAFVAQDVGMDNVEPFTFTASRSFVGGVVLLPVIAFMDKRRKVKNISEPEDKRTLLIGGLLCGTVLCISSAFQQFGIAMGTPSGKAGFITALYILAVPILGIFLKKKVRPIIWFCVAIAIGGLYLLCVTDGLGSVQLSDLLVLICAICFAGHIHIVDSFSPRVNGVKMSCIQFFVCGVLSLIPALIFEKPTMDAVMRAAIPILYAGVMSSGVAYTLQIIGQKYTPPTLASLVMSLESVFAMLTGMVVLHQIPKPREAIGCAIVFAAIIIAQLPEKRKEADVKQ